MYMQYCLGTQVHVSLTVDTVLNVLFVLLKKLCFIFLGELMFKMGNFWFFY